MKAILHLFTALCEYHESIEVEFPKWAMETCVTVASTKIGDKKLSGPCKAVLLSACAVCAPHLVVLKISEALGSVRAPLAHEEAMKWLRDFISEFGAACLGSNVSSIVPWMLQVSIDRGRCRVFVKSKSSCCCAGNEDIQCEGEEGGDQHNRPPAFPPRTYLQGARPFTSIY